MVIIDNPDDQRLSHYKNLRSTPDSHITDKVFIVEGKLNVLKLLNSELEALSLLITEQFYIANYKLIKSKNLTETQIYIAEKNITTNIIGFKHHSGIMAIAKQPEETEIDNMGNYIIAFNRINNSENTGSIIRNAVAFGIDTLIFDKFSSHPFLRRSVRVSMGAIFKLKYKSIENFTESIPQLKNLNYSIVSIELNEQSIPIDEYKPPSKAIIFFGNEGKGIDDKILNLSDVILSIPIINNDSLNVASASAIALHQLTKKRLSF